MAASGINNLASTYVPGLNGFDQPVFLAGQSTPTSTGEESSGYSY